MKVSKRQLRQIIKEERAKLMSEAVSQSLIENLYNAMQAIADAADDPQLAMQLISEEVDGFLFEINPLSQSSLGNPGSWR